MQTVWKKKHGKRILTLCSVKNIPQQRINQKREVTGRSTSLFTLHDKYKKGTLYRQWSQYNNVTCLYCQMEIFVRHAVESASRDTVFIPSFLTIGSGIQVTMKVTSSGTKHNVIRWKSTEVSGGTCHLLFRCQRISKTWNQREADPILRVIWRLLPQQFARGCNVDITCVLKEGVYEVGEAGVA
jgi:plastocyanin